jgi:ribosomal protein S18 acetylase RimI-like enzyme
LVKDNLQIRRAVADDAPLISSLSGVTFYDTFKGTCTDDDMKEFIDTFFNVELVSKELQDSNDFYFIAFVNEKAVGYTRMKEEESDVDIINKYRNIELKRIYVLKEYHSLKIGAELMAFALNLATEKNYELIWLGVWEHNEKAKNFYKKFGFEDSGATHPFPIGSTPQTDQWFYKFI